MMDSTLKKNQTCTTFKSAENCEKQFLMQAVNLVQQNIDDDGFKFKQFATEMANSKSTLYRRLKELTGLTPVELIKAIRLDYAVEMLINDNCNISEVAYNVGFNNPKYFSRCFKRKFGLSPKEYKRAMINMN